MTPYGLVVDPKPLQKAVKSSEAAAKPIAAKKPAAAAKPQGYPKFAVKAVLSPNPADEAKKPVTAKPASPKEKKAAPPTSEASRAETGSALHLRWTEHSARAWSCYLKTLDSSL